MPYTTVTDLIEYSTAEQLAGAYRDSIAKIREAVLTICQETNKLKFAFGEDCYRFNLDLYRCGRSYSCGEEGLAEVVDGMHREAWGVIIDKLNIRRLMSSKRAAELQDALDGRNRNGGTVATFPPLTPENIERVAQGYMMSATEFLEEAIAEEYDFWRPGRAWGDFKRNSDWKLNRKIIRPYMVEGNYHGGWRCNYHNQQHVTALDSIFSMLAGLGPVKECKGPLASAIEMAEDGKGETDMFRFKCYKNGNLHLEFKRQDLLDLFNSIAGKSDRLGQERKTG